MVTIVNASHSDQHRQKKPFDESSDTQWIEDDIMNEYTMVILDHSSLP